MSTSQIIHHVAGFTDDDDDTRHVYANGPCCKVKRDHRAASGGIKKPHDSHCPVQSLMITLPTRTPHGTKLRSGVRRLLNECYEKRSEDDTFANGLSPVITRLRARVQG